MLASVPTTRAMWAYSPINVTCARNHSSRHWTVERAFDELFEAKRSGRTVVARLRHHWGYVESASVDGDERQSSWRTPNSSTVGCLASGTRVVRIWDTPLASTEGTTGVSELNQQVMRGQISGTLFAP
jgi:hypothetical protein